MTQSTAVLVALAPETAEQVIDLLAAAGLVAVDRVQPDGLTAVIVRSTDLAASQETLDRVLPALLAEGAMEVQENWEHEPADSPGRLSDRLLRRGEPDPDPDTEWYDPAAEDDYTAPLPPPLPRGDLTSRLAWSGAVGGPILMVISLLFDLPSILAGAGLVGFVVGFGVLVARLPDRAAREDGWDDGAVL